MNKSPLPDLIAAILSTAIVINLLVHHQAPWRIIAVYWIVVTAKNWRSLQ